MCNQKKQLNSCLRPLNGTSADYDSVLKASQDVEHVFVGEATHGTHEFYKIRAEITKRLIIEENFNVVTIEGNWPNTYRINRYVKGDKTIKNVTEALSGFKRFPTWMWRNDVVVEFIDWLKQYNANLPLNKRVGFYGLDIYSLNDSTEIIINYLEEKDPSAAKRAKKRYSCFEYYKDELQNYGYAVELDMTKSCEDEVMLQLMEFNKDSYKYIKESDADYEEFFYILQNTYLVKNAEKYYRSIFDSKASSWNIRENHMVETLDHLIQYLNKKLPHQIKTITWAHNSHVGDARATEVRVKGQLNIGQLVREKYGDKALLIGFLTNNGFVTASSKWNGNTEYKKIYSAHIYSYEYFFNHCMRLVKAVLQSVIR
jgi:erythromycin esterase-like protein